MSVLIKGMDKETAVRICAYTEVRMDDSDFVSVPPHGRLIDADALKPYMLNKHYKYRLVYDADEVANSPTIIPAEK